MSCLNPVTIRLYAGTDKERYQLVRCRHCEDCKQSMRSSAFVRLHSEYRNAVKQKGIVLFFTLTFADEFVPFKFHRMCFDKRLVQEWLQFVRQEFRRKYGKSIKYFLVSELGHVGTHRPHHHGLLFLYDNDKYQLKSWKEGGKFHSRIPIFPHSYARIVASMWQFGRADVQEYDNSKGGIQYVAKYISKFDEEEKLFNDIITSIQMKRGKGNVEKSVKYYSDTFPSLHAFMQRYCAFTMISKGIGESLNICDECIIAQKPVFIDGFTYNIPRYYSDRYVRKEIKAAQEFVTHPSDLSDCEQNSCYIRLLDRPTYFKISTASSEYLKFGRHDEFHPIDPSPNDLPSPKVLDKYRTFTDSIGNFVYGPMPYYERKFRYSGESYMRQVLPKISEVSQLSQKRKEYRYLNLLDVIETRYYNLPELLQNSCSFDIPKLLQDTKQLINQSVDYQLTELGLSVLQELDELTQVHSDWRARSRLDRMEQKRKEKMSRNTPYAKKRLSWEEYRVKSRYMSSSIKYKM